MKKRMIRPIAFAMAAVLAFSVGCATKQETETNSEDGAVPFPEEMFVSQDFAYEEALGEQMVPLSGEPLATGFQNAVATGAIVYYGSENKDVEIDASNTADGYVMVKYTGNASSRLKVMISGPNGIKYTYDLNNKGKHEAFVLSSGSGKYTVGVFQNIEGAKYSTLCSQTIDAKLTSETAPFLRPNQYVNYTENSEVVRVAKTLTKDSKDELEKVQKVYEYITANIVYDKEKAATVQSGYLPVVDQVLATKKGICFDYAAVMAAMLRSQGVPTKLVTGYTGSAYHAWISIYTAKTGWIEGVVFFDGNTWKIMDPTFAASGNGSEAVMKYIGDGKNYTEKYLY